MMILVAAAACQTFFDQVQPGIVWPMLKNTESFLTYLAVGSHATYLEGYMEILRDLMTFFQQKFSIN